MSKNRIGLMPRLTLLYRLTPTKFDMSTPLCIERAKSSDVPVRHCKSSHSRVEVDLKLIILSSLILRKELHASRRLSCMML